MTAIVYNVPDIHDPYGHYYVYMKLSGNETKEQKKFFLDLMSKRSSGYSKKEKAYKVLKGGFEGGIKDEIIKSLESKGFKIVDIQEEYKRRGYKPELTKRDNDDVFGPTSSLEELSYYAGKSKRSPKSRRSKRSPSARKSPKSRKTPSRAKSPRQKAAARRKRNSKGQFV